MLHQEVRHRTAADQADRILAAFRRVSHVRVDRNTGDAVVVGIRHRLPVELRVSVAVAEALEARGVRCVHGRRHAG